MKKPVVIRDEISRLERSNPDAASLDIAWKVVRGMPAFQRDELLAEELSWMVDGIRRERVRTIEQAAVASSRAKAEAEYLAAHGRHSWEEDPEKIAARRARNQEEWLKYPWTAPRNTRFRQTWDATPEGQSWAAEQARLESEEQERHRLFRDDPDAYSEKYGWGRVQRIWNEELGKIRTAAKLELTAELLGSSFALGDGTSVAWGSATLDEHRKRVELLMQNVDGNLSTIAVHEAAAELLRSSGAVCLNELATEAAA